jgi:hypothetical protein
VGVLTVALLAWWATTGGGYENASAALFLVAFWAALLVAARRDIPRRGRGVLLPAAGLLLELGSGRHDFWRVAMLDPHSLLLRAVAQTGAVGGALLDRLSEYAVPGPIERRPVDCLPVLGLGASCAGEGRG